MSSPSLPPAAAPVIEDDRWTNCSSAELKEIVKAGVAGGDRFMAAVREIERRSNVSLVRTDSIETEKKLREARNGRVMLAAGIAALLLAVVTLALI